MFGQLALLLLVAISGAVCWVRVWCEVRWFAANAVPLPARATTSAAASETLRAITCNLLSVLRLASKQTKLGRA
jgi:hypothetical protein